MGERGFVYNASVFQRSSRIYSVKSMEPACLTCLHLQLFLCVCHNLSWRDG
jgi:hypothetical protein